MIARSGSSAWISKWMTRGMDGSKGVGRPRHRRSVLQAPHIDQPEAMLLRRLNGFVERLQVERPQHLHLRPGVALEAGDADAGVEDAGRLAGGDEDLVVVRTAEREVAHLSGGDGDVAE